jgi:channel protein (hemolysin III family)
MNIESVVESKDDFIKSSAHTLGYLMGIAYMPVLLFSLRHVNLTVVAVLAVAIVAARFYLGASVRDALSPVRSKAVLRWVDMAALFVGLASAYTVFAYDSLQHGDGWTLCLVVWALAAAGCSVGVLSRATHTWYSSTFISQFIEPPADGSNVKTSK